MKHSKSLSRGILTLAILSGLVFGTGAAHSATATKTFDQVYQLASSGHLILSNVNGSIEVSAWDRNEVRVRATKTVRAATEEKARDGLDDLRIEIQENSNSIQVTTVHPRSSGVWGWIFGGHSAGEVDYELTVPRDISIDLETVNGKITGRGARGELRLRTTNGDVLFENGAGQANVRTTNGSIRIVLDEVPIGSELSFITVNGGIRLSLPATVMTNLDVSTINGSITTDLPIAVRGKVQRRRLSGEINGGGSSMELRTTNGSIRILEI